MMLRFVGRRAVARAIFLGALGLLIASAGLHAAEPSPAPSAEHAREATPAPSPSMQPPTGNGPMVSAMTPLAADRGYAKSLVALGFDEATADFMARTLSTVEILSPGMMVVRHAFPNGATAEVTYRIVRGSASDPAAPPEWTGEAGVDEYRFGMRYALDPDKLPAELLAQLDGSLPSAAPALASSTVVTVHQLGLAPLVPARGRYAADTPGAYEVVVDGVISQSQEAFVDTWVEKAEKKGWTKTAGSWEALKSGKKVWEAVEANEVIATALARLKALRACAQEPTNPLTRKAYAEDQAEQQRVVDAVDQAEKDIRASAMVMFGSMLTDTGSSLLKSAPWLGFIVGPANGYVKETNLGLIKEYLRVAEQRVVPCHSSYTVSGTIPSIPSGITVSGKVCSLEKPFELKTKGDVTGTLTARPGDASGGALRYQGTVSNSGFKATASGAYAVTLSEDRASGTLDGNLDMTIKIPIVGGRSGGGEFSLTLTQAKPCDG